MKTIDFLIQTGNIVLLVLKNFAKCYHISHIIHVCTHMHTHIGINGVPLCICVALTVLSAKTQNENEYTE